MTFSTTSRTLVGAIAAAVLALSACGTDGDDPGDDPTLVPGEIGEPSGDDVATLDAVEWNETGGEPEIDFDTPFSVSAPTVRLVSDGDGDDIESGQVVTVHYTVSNGADAEVLFSTYVADTPEGISVGSGELEPALDQLLTDSRVGANILFAAPDPSLVDDLGNPGAVVMAITVTSVADVLDRAEGTAVDPEEGLPEVTLDDAGAPTLGATEGEPTGEFVAQLLIEGDGAEVQPGATITAHYTGWLWDGEQFDSSWERPNPLTIPLAPGGVIEGWIEGLVGQQVGSQVLLIIPPELGYQEQGSGTIPGGATLIFVVDILGAV